MQARTRLADVHPELIAEWHPTLNGTLSVYNIGIKSNKVVWWLGACGHEWDTPVFCRSRGYGCPICSGHRVLAGFNDLATTHPRLTAEWHSRNTLVPSELSFGSKEVVWWVCSAGHSWKATIQNRTGLGRGCPMCAGQKVVTGVNDLTITHPELVKEWSKKNPSGPEHYLAQSNKKIHWVCSEQHEWDAVLYSRAGLGTGCPICANSRHISHGEQQMTDFIKSLGVTVVQNDRKILHGLELDAYIPEIGLAFEYNGTYWHSEKFGRGDAYHEKKTRMCQESGIVLTHIKEFDWTNRRPYVEAQIRALITDAITMGGD